MPKPILVLDFDGVLHRYDSGWQGATIIPDPPTPGMVPFLRRAVEAFDVHILSSRSGQPGGIEAMQRWLRREIEEYFDVGFAGAPRDQDRATALFDAIKFPTEKPAAFVTIDDRAICFDGKWPKVADLLEFRPWNKRIPSNGSTGTESHNAGLIRLTRRALMSMFRRERSSPAE